MICLFNSLSHFIPLNSDAIRQKICDYLQQNATIMDGLDTKFILNLENNNYIPSMRKSTTWGGAIEIQAACNLWKLKIMVQNSRNAKQSAPKCIEFLPVTGGFTKEISLDWTGGHYEPIRTTTRHAIPGKK